MIFSHPILKACNGCLFLYSSAVIFLFLIKRSRQKAIEIETAFFDSLGNPKGRTLDHCFNAWHFRHNFFLNTDTYIDGLVEILLKSLIKTVQVHLIIWTTVVSWLESIWSIMFHTARIVLALLTLGTWWYYMPRKRSSRNNMNIYFSQFYSLRYFFLSRYICRNGLSPITILSMELLPAKLKELN